MRAYSYRPIEEWTESGDRVRTLDRADGEAADGLYVTLSDAEAAVTAEREAILEYARNIRDCEYASHHYDYRQAADSMVRFLEARAQRSS